jgi:hypothetical protein
MWQPVDWVLTVLGVALLGTGVWYMCSPRPTGIVLDAVTLLLVGAYNLVGAILAVMDELPPSPARAFLGALQLVWGIQRLRNFRQFANAFLERPVDSESKEIEQVVWAIVWALAKGPTDADAARGRKQTPRARRSQWFMGEHARFVELARPRPPRARPQRCGTRARTIRAGARSSPTSRWATRLSHVRCPTRSGCSSSGRERRFVSGAEAA